jgi:H+/Cl- antiporter ClcA
VESPDGPVAGPPASVAADPFAPLRSRGYLVLLLLAAVLGAVLSAGAWGFLQAVSHLQTVLYTDLPKALGFTRPPAWWPLPPLALAGVLVGAAVRYLPGTGGHEPAEGLKTAGVTVAADLPGILLAALASLGFGAVLGPEAPLITLGGGLAVYAVRLIQPGADARTQAVVGAAGSFAAVSALLGSPLLGAFLLMEASGLGGPMLGIVLLPGLLAAGVGDLVFIGLGSLAGVGTVTLSIPGLPAVRHPDVAQFGWALVIGCGAALLGTGVHRLALLAQRQVNRRRALLTPLAGLCVAGLAIGYAEGTGKPWSDVLFSGQSSLPQLLLHNPDYTVGALTLLLACKWLAYGASLAAFRGGPIFPAMFLGAVGGIALAHLPGLPVVAGAAMGIGAMSVAMLRLPMTSVLLATLLLGQDGLTVMPLVIVAVVVCQVMCSRLTPPPATAPATAPASAPLDGGRP